MNSLRSRLIISLILPLLLINIVAGIYIYNDTRVEIEEVFNAEQAQLARTIESVISHAAVSDNVDSIVSQVPDLKNEEEGNIDGHYYERKIAYQVWDLAGNLLLMSENAPLHPLSASTPGFSEMKYTGERWYVFSLYSNSSEMWIFTAQRHDVRDELIELITRDQLTSLMTLNIALLILVFISLAYAFRPIHELSTELNERGERNLRPLDMTVCKELDPIKLAANRLIERIEVTLAKEKNFNADLAHELKTPLSVIKVHAQNIEMRDDISQDAKQSLGKMLNGITQMSSTIEQLLLLNQIESQKGYQNFEEVNLIEIAREVISLLPASILQSYEIALDGENVFMSGNRALLTNLLRNLLENAYKYSPSGSQISVSAYENGERAFLEVRDSGKGMTDEQKANSVKRHYRVSDTQSYGSGLGLSIVMKIVELHHGEIEFLDNKESSGLLARVSFTP